MVQLLYTLATTPVLAQLVEELHFETYAPEHLGQITQTPVDVMLACSRLKSFAFKNQFSPPLLTTGKRSEIIRQVGIRTRGASDGSTMDWRYNALKALISQPRHLLHLDTTLTGLATFGCFGQASTLTFLRLSMSDPRRPHLPYCLPNLPNLKILTLYFWADVFEHVWEAAIYELLDQVGSNLVELAISEQTSNFVSHAHILDLIKRAPNIATLRIKGSSLFELDNLEIAHPTVENLLLNHHLFGPSNDRLDGWLIQLEKKRWPKLKAVWLNSITWSSYPETEFFRTECRKWVRAAKENEVALLDHEGNPPPLWVTNAEWVEPAEDEGFESL
ncbi:hypothetical protein BDY24DRAFT_420524, partial [Mrakia frigida]|uniref:uncharacterized protein n=1 Tax=Mrakia frigida TaxID=29902 RepID=UPI003FCBF10A